MKVPYGRVFVYKLVLVCDIFGPDGMLKVVQSLELESMIRQLVRLPSQWMYIILCRASNWTWKLSAVSPIKLRCSIIPIFDMWLKNSNPVRFSSRTLTRSYFYKFRSPRRGRHQVCHQLRLPSPEWGLRPQARYFPEHILFFQCWICYELLATFRIGRTGRRNNAGTAYTFFTEKNGKNAGPLIQILTEAKQVAYISLNVWKLFFSILLF
jgi:hypothetical protein